MLEHLTLRPQPVVSPLDSSYHAFILSRQAMRCTPKTLAHYTYTLSAFIDWLKAQGVRDVADITPTHVRAYLVHLQTRGLKDTTQHAHARGIRTWLNWLVAEGDLDASPMRKVAMPRLEKRIPPPFTPEEVQALLAACDRKTVLGARNYALCLVLLDSGLRASEVVSLKVGDIDPRTGLATVMGKGRKMRQVVLGAKARGAILKMLGHRPEVRQGDPLWLAYNNRGEPVGRLTTHGLQVTLRRLGRKAGVVPCGPHRFRRTFALWCLRNGMDIETLRLLMGHSSLAVLQRYLALAGEDLQRAHAAHSPVDRLMGG